VEYSGECDYKAFEDAYCGEAESEEDYARTMAEECGLLNDIPESLRCYFDMGAWARDLFWMVWYFWMATCSTVDVRGGAGPRHKVE
jgi:antirestriction protein